jgi:hypothetical protein
MNEQRRHQRIRFKNQPLLRLGHAGATGMGRLENLSLGGLMLRTDLPLKVGEAFGCEFSVFAPVLIDISPVVVSRVGEMFCARMQPGPVSARLLEDVVARSLAVGKASVLSVNEVQGRRVLRVLGGLNVSLRSDFLHTLSKGGVDAVDLSGVTDMDSDGAELCRIAAEEHRVDVLRPDFEVNPRLAEIAGWSSQSGR